jgi:hypothetical protein
VLASAYLPREVVPGVTGGRQMRGGEVKPGTAGEKTLLVNGDPVDGGRMDHTVPFIFSGYSGHRHTLPAASMPRT